MSASLVGSEMCIRDRPQAHHIKRTVPNSRATRSLDVGPAGNCHRRALLMRAPTVSETCVSASERRALALVSMYAEGKG
eukprot:11920571-Alexandrium_andersonii.AAC.1